MTVPPLLRPPEPGTGRPSAVLMLFGETEGEPDLLIVQRSPWLRRHAGQPAFPGGAIEAADHGPVGAALREAAEEAGVDPAGVEVLAVLPELYISRSGFSVIPVLAWWRAPVPVTIAADGEVTAAVRVAFRVHGMLIWGFTAFLVDMLLAIGGWERPWDTGHEEDLPPDVLESSARG
jgi:8-oxo-dGTP pyrophosphatase MutT (NUDIX family)